MRAAGMKLTQNALFVCYRYSYFSCIGFIPVLAAALLLT
jgi:hypothetical protein